MHFIEIFLALNNFFLHFFFFVCYSSNFWLTFKCGKFSSFKTKNLPRALLYMSCRVCFLAIFVSQPNYFHRPLKNVKIMQDFYFLMAIRFFFLHRNLCQLCSFQCVIIGPPEMTTPKKNRICFIDYN